MIFRLVFIIHLLLHTPLTRASTHLIDLLPFELSLYLNNPNKNTRSLVRHATLLTSSSPEPRDLVTSLESSEYILSIILSSYLRKDIQSQLIHPTISYGAVREVLLSQSNPPRMDATRYSSTFSYSGIIIVDSTTNSTVPTPSKIQSIQLISLNDERSVLLHTLQNSNDDALSRVVEVSYAIVTLHVLQTRSKETSFESRIIVITSIVVAALSMLLLVVSLRLGMKKRFEKIMGRELKVKESWRSGSHKELPSRTGNDLEEEEEIENIEIKNARNPPLYHHRSDTPPVIETRSDNDTISDYTESVYSSPFVHKEDPSKNRNAKDVNRRFVSGWRKYRQLANTKGSNSSEERLREESHETPKNLKASTRFIPRVLQKSPTKTASSPPMNSKNGNDPETDSTGTLGSNAKFTSIFTEMHKGMVSMGLTSEESKEISSCEKSGHKRHESNLSLESESYWTDETDMDPEELHIHESPFQSRQSETRNRDELNSDVDGVNSILYPNQVVEDDIASSLSAYPPERVQVEDYKQRITPGKKKKYTHERRASSDSMDSYGFSLDCGLAEESITRSKVSL